MTVQTLAVGRKKLIVLEEQDYKRLLRLAGQRGHAKTKSQKNPTLKELNDWMSSHWGEVIAKAKKNTRRLTGQEHL